MEIGIDTLFTVGCSVGAACAAVAIIKNDVAHVKEALKSAKEAADNQETKRVAQASEVFQRITQLEQSRPTHEDLAGIQSTISSMESRVRGTETGIATMSVEIKGIEKSISRINHTCVSTNALVQLLVLNSPSLSAKEKAEFLSSQNPSADK